MSQNAEQTVKDAQIARKPVRFVQNGTLSKFDPRDPGKRRSLADVLRHYAEAPSGCWEWLGARNRYGYGKFKALVNGRFMDLGVHRLQYMHLYGEIPTNGYICHRCDNPICINPQHLFLGTAADNVADMRAKGRTRVISGSAHVRATIDEATAGKVKALGAAGVRRRDIAAQLSVSLRIVENILRGESWRNVPPAHDLGRDMPR